MEEVSAISIAIKNRPTVREVMEEYYKAVAPYEKEKIKIINLLPLRKFIYEDDKLIDVEIIHTPESKAAIDKLNTIIENIRMSMGLPLLP